jgi:hypothetical protein
LIGRAVCPTAVGLMLLVGISAKPSAAIEPTRTIAPARLVLAQKDVGDEYVQNRGFSRRRTLQDAGSGDSPAIRQRLRDLWLSGYQTGFNGRTVTWGIVSTVDVFRNAGLAQIERAWKGDVLRLTQGRPLPVPSAAPGSFRVLVRGRLSIGQQSAEIVVYMWQDARAIASVTVSGRPRSFPISLVVSLAKRQDAKLRRAFR